MNSQIMECEQTQIKKQVAIGYFSIFILALGAFIAYLALTEQHLIILALLAIPVVVVIITQPRWAVYQYILCLFIMVIINRDIPVSLMDISALIVIAAAGWDLLASDRFPRRFPRLFFNFVLLLAAVSTAAAFSYNPAASINPIGRITFLIVTFLSLYSLLTKTKVGTLIRLFFWVGVAHSVIAVVPFMASAGKVRSFGLAGVAFDDLAMITLPVGLALFLWSKGGRATKYLLGSMVVFVGLVATQSRASLGFAIFASAVVFILSITRSRRTIPASPSVQSTSFDSQALPAVKKRVSLLCLCLVLLVLAAIVFAPGVSHAVSSRLESILAWAPTGTGRRRLELWRSALMAFSHHPVFGVGPGSFRMFYQIFPSLHMHNLFIYIRGLSAHNLFLHYLAESGLVGASAIIALFVNLFRISRLAWRQHLPIDQIGVTLALHVVGLIFLVTTFLEAGWMWGQFGFSFVFFAALIVSHQRQVNK